MPNRGTSHSSRPAPDPSSSSSSQAMARGRSIGPPDRAAVPALALLPLRIFLGGMFLYAGLDKLLDPVFLRATGPGSIGEQLLAFERASPLAPLIHAIGDPFPVLVGLGIALLEIAIGIGALLGIAYRWVAVAGAALSVLFFLTASWATRPLYLGADLPYAVGWATLALAGHGGVWALDDWLARNVLASSRTSTVDPDRRRILELGFLAGASVAVATVVRALPLPDATTAGPLGASSDGAAPPATTASAGDPPGATGSSGSGAGTEIASVDQVQQRGIVGFRDPSNGDPAVLMKLSDGRIVCYDAICTHEGCTVGYDRGSGLLVCPCHGAAFDPEHDAEVVGGPTDRPLPTLPIRIDEATGRIYLQT
jgi:thiosulfate dehydrogenase [quinone] large subunit